MSDIEVQVAELAALVLALQRDHGVKTNEEACGPLLFVGVTDTEAILRFRSLITERFGDARKAAGASAMWKNLFDPLVRKLGGLRKEQTLFARALTADGTSGLTAYCMLWPWGRNPAKVSVRIGLLCEPSAAAELARTFRWRG